MSRLASIAAYGSDSDDEADINSGIGGCASEGISRGVEVTSTPSNSAIPVDADVIGRLNDYADLKLKDGFDLVSSICSKKEFSNPNILAKAVSYFDIDEVGSNYPRDSFNPHDLGFDADNVTAISATISSASSAPNLQHVGTGGFPRTLSLQNINMASASFSQQHHIPVTTMPSAVQTFTSSVTGAKRMSRFA
jgi:hypothetical protein